MVVNKVRWWLHGVGQNWRCWFRARSGGLVQTNRHLFGFDLPTSETPTASRETVKGGGGEVAGEFQRAIWAKDLSIISKIVQL